MDICYTCGSETETFTFAGASLCEECIGQVLGHDPKALPEEDKKDEE